MKWVKGIRLLVAEHEAWWHEGRLRECREAPGDQRLAGEFDRCHFSVSFGRNAGSLLVQFWSKRRWALPRAANSLRLRELVHSLRGLRNLGTAHAASVFFKFPIKARIDSLPLDSW